MSRAPSLRCWLGTPRRPLGHGHPPLKNNGHATGTDLSEVPIPYIFGLYIYIYIRPIFAGNIPRYGQNYGTVHVLDPENPIVLNGMFHQEMEVSFWEKWEKMVDSSRIIGESSVNGGL